MIGRPGGWGIGVVMFSGIAFRYFLPYLDEERISEYQNIDEA